MFKKLKTTSQNVRRVAGEIGDAVDATLGFPPPHWQHRQYHEKPFKRSRSFIAKVKDTTKKMKKVAKELDDAMMHTIGF
jgi:hypothetical protein